MKKIFIKRIVHRKDNNVDVKFDRRDINEPPRHKSVPINRTLGSTTPDADPYNMNS